MWDGGSTRLVLGAWRNLCMRALCRWGVLSVVPYVCRHLMYISARWYDVCILTQCHIETVHNLGSTDNVCPSALALKTMISSPVTKPAKLQASVTAWLTHACRGYVFFSIPYFQSNGFCKVVFRSILIHHTLCMHTNTRVQAYVMSRPSEMTWHAGAFPR